MSEIKIRNVPKNVISKIDEDWKKQSYKSRNEYLNKQLELMILLESLKNGRQVYLFN